MGRGDLSYQTIPPASTSYEECYSKVGLQVSQRVTGTFRRCSDNDDDDDRLNGIRLFSIGTTANLLLELNPKNGKVTLGARSWRIQ